MCIPSSFLNEARLFSPFPNPKRERFHFPLHSPQRRLRIYKPKTLAPAPLPFYTKGGRWVDVEGGSDIEGLEMTRVFFLTLFSFPHKNTAHTQIPLLLWLFSIFFVYKYRVCSLQWDSLSLAIPSCLLLDLLLPPCFPSSRATLQAFFFPFIVTKPTHPEATHSVNTHTHTHTHTQQRAKRRKQGSIRGKAGGGDEEEGHSKPSTDKKKWRPQPIPPPPRGKT